MPPKVTSAITTISITDRDTIASVEVFKDAREYKTYTEALEKLVARAARLNLHHLTDSEFEKLVQTVTR